MSSSVAPSNPAPTSEPVVESSTPPTEPSTSAVQTSEPPAQTTTTPPTEPSSNPPTEPSSVAPSNSGNNPNPPATTSAPDGNTNPPQTTAGGGSTDNGNTNGNGNAVTTGNPGSQPTGGNGSGTTNTGGGSNAQTTQVNKDGQTVVIVYETVTSNGVVYTTAVSSSLPGNNKSSSSHVGAIVGGTVGGVVGLLAVLVFLFVLLRKRKKRNYRDAFDDMMFDPSRSQNHGPIDLSDDQGAPTIDPYEYKPVPGVASTLVTPQQEMAQAYPHSGSDGVSRAPTSSAATSAGYAGYGAGANASGMAGYGAGMNAFPQPHTQSGSSPISPNSSQGAPMSAKQLEAYQEAQRFRVQNPSAGPSGGLTVHEDGGAYSEAGPSDGNEIPPTYDSIRR